MIYERKSNQQVLYVLPITSILSKLPLVPVGDTGTIPNSMQGEAADFDGGSCDSKPGERDGSLWWYDDDQVRKFLGNDLVVQDAINILWLEIYLKCENMYKNARILHK